MLNNINEFVLIIVPLLFAVTIHEVAHGYVAYRMGDSTAKMAGRLSLNPVRHLDPVGSFFLPIILYFSGSPFLFGYAKPVPVNFANLYDYRRGTIFVGAAGVVANLICAVLSGLLFQFLIYAASLWHGSFLQSLVIPFLNMLNYSVIINLVLAVFNMIPIPPLDGSRILAMFLPESLRIPFQRIERYGMIIIILLLMTKSLGKIIFFFVTPLCNLLLGT
ncbi:site-2 protease family protein [Desulfonema magnum]|uniref:Peptidase M50 domain-containing protein n=1 Tax=Desulfonema magnum TaxID=45655 RepID=A0A975GQV0_9BACT|nr:site-2 protease family protein [Desulfonema magnum]QTA90285.1 Peptidase M50 domain-containing protein [Desulfonema magnum]